MLSHKTLIAWQKARRLAILVSRANRRNWQPWAKTFWDQLQRASVSAQINIAEGYAGLSRRRWIWFLSIAHGSAIEALEVVELLRDLEALPVDEAAELKAAAEESVRVIIGLLKHSRSNTPAA